MANSAQSLLQWCQNMPALLKQQMDKTLTREAWEGVMETPRYFDARKIILTGCGGSFAAAKCMLDVFANHTDIFWGTEVMEPIEFSRFVKAADLGIGEPHTPLVVAISQSGESSRIIEVIEKTHAVGGNSLLITAAPQSTAAQKAQHIYAVDYPAQPDAVCESLSFYLAAQVALLALAERTGYLRGTLSATTLNTWRGALASYTDNFAAMLPGIETQMRQVATQWKDLWKFEFTGDYSEYASAVLCAAKYAEVLGAHTSYNDVEEWCHVDYWTAKPTEIATVVFARQASPSFGRSVETAGSMKMITRPAITFTDAPASAFAEGVPLCAMPKTPEGCAFLSPMLYYVPPMLALAHLAESREENDAPFKYADATDHSQIEIIA